LAIQIAQDHLAVAQVLVVKSSRLGPADNEAVREDVGTDEGNTPILRELVRRARGSRRAMQ
jgi:hypothetical protein